jgi:quercetin dioxygenase-like cupin family protein
MKTTRFTRTLFAVLFVASLLAYRMAPVAIAQAPAHVMENLSAAKWGPAPPMLPPGAQIAVLAGDPTKAVPFAVRLKFPANYTIPPHSHPTDENVLVVSGELSIGMGKTLDRKTATPLGVGGFALMPARGNHAAFTKDETVILLYGQGPVEFTYVNAADDPRTKKPATR